MSTLLAGFALMVSGTGFLARFAIGAKDATRWPVACMGTRAILLIMGIGCMVRGIHLARGHGLIDGAGAAICVLIAVYSITILGRDLKQRRPETFHLFH